MDCCNRESNVKWIGCLTVCTCLAKTIDLTLRGKEKSSAQCCADAVCVQARNGSAENGTKTNPLAKRADSTLYARRLCSRLPLSLLFVHMCTWLMHGYVRGVSLKSPPRSLWRVIPRSRFPPGRFCTPVARVFACRVCFRFAVETTCSIFILTSFV
jgi:hypothetical protein